MKSLLALLFAFALLLGPPKANALSDSATLPIFLYHSWQISGCDANINAPMALARDLETFHRKGFTVVPAYWIAQWALSQRPGSSLPSKVVGITFDDGFNRDWVDGVLSQHELANGACPTVKSFRTVLNEFKASHPDLPSYSPHASNFVIASPVARMKIFANAQKKGTDDWWNAAQQSPIMEIYNHSADHDHNTIESELFEPEPLLNMKLAVGGYTELPSVPGRWAGKGTFLRIGDDTDTDGNTLSANYEVVRAGMYIQSKIGVWPDMFAFPFGGHSAKLDQYFLNKASEHNTYAAFTTSAKYVKRGDSRYELSRFVNQNPDGGWHTTAELEGILDGAYQPSATFFINDQMNGSISLPGGTPFTLRYISQNMATCDLTAHVNGVLWYSATNLPTSYDWGTVNNFGPSTVVWTVTCHNSSGPTASASATLVMPFPTASFYLNGQQGGNFSLSSGTPFTLSYASTYTTSCDLAGYINGQLWYWNPNFSTSFNWGTVTGFGTGTYQWSIFCHDQWGGTTNASATLTMTPPTAAFLINGQTNGNITLPSGTPFTLSYSSIGTSSCDLTGYINGAVWYSNPNFSTAFNWGTVTGLGSSQYHWLIACHNSLGETATANAYLTMP